MDARKLRLAHAGLAQRFICLFHLAVASDAADIARGRCQRLQKHSAVGQMPGRHNDDEIVRRNGNVFCKLCERSVEDPICLRIVFRMCKFLAFVIYRHAETHVRKKPRQCPANMAAAHMVQAQAEAMKTAAGNSAGAMTGFMGMGMAMNAGGGGMNAQNLFAMGQQQQQQQQTQQTPAAAPAAEGWKCKCGATATGKFCPECGSPKPAEDGWTCSCGTVNKGKFCQNCGSKKPEGAPLYRCDKCGWEPEDPAHPPKFCPECGDLFDENDRK